MNLLKKTHLINWLKNHGGGGSSSGFPPDWSEIGYEDTPDVIIDGFNYAKEIHDNWDSSITSMSGKYNGDNNLLFFPLVDTSNVTNMASAFRDCTQLIYIPLVDTSNVTNMVRTFGGVSAPDLPLFDTSKVTTFDYTFSGNKYIKTLKNYNTSNATDVHGIVNNCTNLVNFPVLNLQKATRLDSMFNNCSKLSDDSLDNIMASLLTATNYTGTKTLKYIGLSSAQATTCTTLSNWTELSNAGWTTGY